MATNDSKTPANSYQQMTAILFNDDAGPVEHSGRKVEKDGQDLDAPQHTSPTALGHKPSKEKSHEFDKLAQTLSLGMALGDDNTPKITS